MSLVQAADLADDRPQDLLDLLMDALFGPHFTGSQRSTEPPLGAKHSSQLLHEGVLKLRPAIRAHERRKSPASQDTAGKRPTHLTVSQGLKRLEKDCVTQAVEVGQGIAIAIPVFPIRAFAVHADLLPAGLCAAFDSACFDLGRPSPSFEASKALTHPKLHVSIKIRPPYGPLKELDGDFGGSMRPQDAVMHCIIAGATPSDAIRSRDPVRNHGNANGLACSESHISFQQAIPCYAHWRLSSSQRARQRRISSLSIVPGGTQGPRDPELRDVSGVPSQDRQTLTLEHRRVRLKRKRDQLPVNLDLHDFGPVIPGRQDEVRRKHLQHQNGFCSQRLAMSKSLLPVAVPPSFDTSDFPMEVDEASKRRIEGDGQTCGPPQTLALKVNDLTVAMPIRFSTLVELGVLRSPTRGPLMAWSHSTIMMDYPTRPVSITDLCRHTAKAEGPDRSRLPETSSDLAVRSGNKAQDLSRSLGV